MAILTISRQYGSGGREIGRRLAELMVGLVYCANLFLLHS
jgi:hypothetical protein